MHHYLAALDAFALWFGLAVALCAVFVFIYLWITPQHELALIHEGNVSAAVCLAGTILGYVLPLASAMVHGIDVYDFLCWGIVAMLVQLAVYLGLRLCFRSLTHDILEDRVSVAILAACLSLAAGILNAAALSD